MRNGLVQLGAWAAATGAAVALSWFGVHAVLVDAGFEQPSALPLPSATGGTPDDPSTGQVAVATVGEATQRPADPSSSPSPSPTPSSKPSPTAVRKASTATSVHSYLVPGGRVALDMKADRAELVSATPDSGWQMQVWQDTEWMRIDFSKGSSTNSVFVTWNGHPPDVQTVVR
ncbi:hypothetical protein GCM10010193_19560 [Kitasatospora atroaurantiaca]|uniref:Secreted protein n=1 Tax=Kitasatospora atroaurantiaca TaxID=285545 RepID=A0A561EPM6_9ACTN|nr:hypothetical protein [Kitasatospora atroaurantiaca]TWE17544.1 hypothetical protein FB465_2576 [Kitasatospora atroaurantiaca]